MNQVDHDAAAARGIPVTNVPAYCSDEVADQGMTLLLALWRHLVPIVDLVEAHGWRAIRRSHHLHGIRRINGKTLGIIGAGRIGTRVANRARGFGLKVIAADPFVESLLEAAPSCRSKRFCPRRTRSSCAPRSRPSRATC